MGITLRDMRTRLGPAGWRSGRALALYAAVIVVLAAALIVTVGRRGDERAAAAPLSSSSNASSNASSSPPAPGAPVEATPVASAPPASPAPPHDPVAAAAPSSFRIAGPAFTIDANVCQMANVRPLDPPGDQYHTVCWVHEGFGVAPGSASGGTSYILGHAWASAPLVLNPLSETAMAQAVNVAPTPLDGIDVRQVDVLNGYAITLQLPGGTLAYTVTRTYTVPKTMAAKVASLMNESTPDRIVLITCAVHDGRDIEDNVIVEAYLTSSAAA